MADDISEPPNIWQSQQLILASEMPTGATPRNLSQEAFDQIIDELGADIYQNQAQSLCWACFTSLFTSVMELIEDNQDEEIPARIIFRLKCGQLLVIEDTGQINATTETIPIQLNFCLL